MKLPINQGDVIITQEIQPIKMGNLSMRVLKSATVYDAPVNFEVAARDILWQLPDWITLSQLYPDKKMTWLDQSFDLNEKIFISSRFSMPWLVKSIDHKRGRYSLLAVGQNRDARSKDWVGYCNLLKNDDLPSLTEYLTVESVDESFFEKKAVYRFCNGDMERIK